MLCTRLLATTAVATLASISLSSTASLSFAFGAIYSPFSSRLGNNRVMGSSHSSQSSLDQGTASVILPASRGDDDADDGEKKDDLRASHRSDADGGKPLRRENCARTLSNSEQPRSPYDPPSSPIKLLAHYIFLVHGWLGNDLEMAYLSKAFQSIVSPLKDKIEDTGDSLGVPDPKRVKRSASFQSQLLAKKNQQSDGFEVGSKEDAARTKIIVHSVKCNVGKTHDGIRNGGTRLANEMIEFIGSDVQNRLDNENDDANHHVTYSLIGNSLGGLYARYAISLLPHQLHLQRAHGSDCELQLHPNVFCTTATPHLGVSRHTYLPIPRIAETIIGTGMGETGRDLFRLNSEKDLASAAAGNIMNVAVGGVRRLSVLASRDGRGNNANGDVNANVGSKILSSHDGEGGEMQCVIRNMCLQNKYLTPLRSFRQRIAYANAYGTDFQVPTETAAFLHEKSGVGHFVVASRELPCAGNMDGTGGGSQDSKKEKEDNTTSEGEEGLPQFIVAVVQTEQQTRSQSPQKSNELLEMSQSLDALGWTKVFIDVRDQIPVPGLAKPSWLRPPCSSLDDLIRDRSALSFASLQSAMDANVESAESNEGTRDAALPKLGTNKCILTSQELTQSTHSGDSINFPLGHTVMVANSKNEKYSQLNSQGRPVMDKLAEDMVRDVLDFESR